MVGTGAEAARHTQGRDRRKYKMQLIAAVVVVVVVVVVVAAAGGFA